MAKNERGGRAQVEERPDRARRTNDEAWAIIDLERDAMRKKTARLRALRMAKEADATAEPAGKPAKKSRTASKKRAAK
jgi:hypothetical protein